MGIERYSVSLEEEVVTKARRFLKVGQALSPVLNDLLKKWTEEQENES